VRLRLAGGAILVETEAHVQALMLGCLGYGLSLWPRLL
jgi:hypothetical protein